MTEKDQDDTEISLVQGVSWEGEPTDVFVKTTSPHWVVVDYGDLSSVKQLCYLLGDLHVGAENQGGEIVAVSPALKKRLDSAPQED